MGRRSDTNTHTHSCKQQRRTKCTHTKTGDDIIVVIHNARHTLLLCFNYCYYLRFT